MEHLIKNLLKKVRSNISSFYPSILISFMLFIFGPFESYLLNLNEFDFTIAVILTYSILAFFCVVVLLFSISLIFKSNAGVTIYAAFLFGVALALYIQGNFIQVDYGLLDGTEINWSDYLEVGIINTTVWFLCIITPMAVIVLVKKLKRVVLNIIKIGSLSITTILAITLFFLFFSAESKKSNYYFSAEGMFELSNDENIVVFVLDSYDNLYFDLALNLYPEWNTVFEDFTLYEDYINPYPKTKTSIPFMLTGEYYENNKKYSEYLNEAYKENTLFTTLYDNKWDSYVYTNPYCVAKTENTIIKNFRRSVISSPNFSTSKVMYKYVLFKYLPHYLKKFFIVYSGDFNSSLVSYDSELSPYGFDDAKYYKALRKEGIKLTSKNNTFKFYHLNGAHSPYVLDINGNEVDPDETDLVTQYIGVLNIIKDYIGELKKNNKYDNTTIIITADHGEHGAYESVPLLLVKQKNQKGDGDINISYAQIYSSDIRDTILYQVTGDSSYTPIWMIEPDKDRSRRVFFYLNTAGVDGNYVQDMQEKVIEGRYSYGNVRVTGKCYTSEGIITKYPTSYKLGTQINFGKFNDYIDYFYWGISPDWVKPVTTRGHVMNVLLKIEDIGSADLEVQFFFKEVYPAKEKKQSLILYANDEYIDQIICNEETMYCMFHVPRKYIGEDGELRLRFEMPNALSLFENGISNDMNIVALGLQSFMITQKSDNTDFEIDIQLENNKYLINGEDNADGRVIHQDGISYGPYMSIPAGKYRLEIIGNGLERSVNDIFNSGELIPFTIIDYTDSRIVYNFELTKTVKNIEFRVANKSKDNINLKSIIVKRQSQ